MLYFDREGKPLADVMAWAPLHNDLGYKILAKTRVGWRGRVEVSTVWIGLDHRFGGSGPPLIFETMVFGGRHDGWTDRYSTEAEAFVGHKRAVRLARYRVLPVRDVTEVVLAELETKH